MSYSAVWNLMFCICNAKKVLLCLYPIYSSRKSFSCISIWNKKKKKELSALWCKISFMRRSLLHLGVKKTKGIFAMVEA